MFCAKIDGHPKPWFRVVEVDDSWQVLHSEDGAPRISGDTLRSLVLADPGGAKTPRDLSALAYNQAYPAWAVAQADIHQLWQQSTDPTALSPDVPKSFRDAAELVKSARWLSREDRQDLRARLRTSPSPKVQRAVRAALREGATDQERIELVRTELDAAGVQKAPKREPLPSISATEIRLVAFMAVAKPK